MHLMFYYNIIFDYIEIIDLYHLSKQFKLKSFKKKRKYTVMILNSEKNESVNIY
jgi:hypothetical protein